MEIGDFACRIAEVVGPEEEVGRAVGAESCVGTGIAVSRAQVAGPGRGVLEVGRLAGRMAEVVRPQVEVD